MSVLVVLLHVFGAFCFFWVCAVIYVICKNLSDPLVKEGYFVVRVRKWRIVAPFLSLTVYLALVIGGFVPERV